MKANYYNNEFELVKATRQSQYQTITNAIEKARIIRTFKRGTYQFHNGGYLLELFTYAIIDTETGYCLNNRQPLNYNECIQLIQMYC